MLHASTSLRTKTLALSTLTVALIAAPARAADPQLVCFDETYTQELNGNVPGETFHHGIKPAATEPASWTAPINYAKGTAYLYMEVLEKPSKRNTILTVCFDGPKEGYGCFDTKTYTDVGVYETKITMGNNDVWQYGKIAWSQRRDDYHLVIKDPALGGTQGGKPASDYVPTKLRVVLTIVPPGGTYTAPARMSGGSADGGAEGGAGGSATGGAGGSATGGAGGVATGGAGGAATGGAGGSATGGAGGSATGGSSGGGAGGSSGTSGGDTGGTGAGTGGMNGGTGATSGSGTGGKGGSAGSGAGAGGGAGSGTGGSGDSGDEGSTGGKSGGGKSASSGGCALGGGSQVGFASLALLALALLRRRRR